jgi:hypothetical protein
MTCSSRVRRRLEAILTEGADATVADLSTAFQPPAYFLIISGYA